MSGAARGVTPPEVCARVTRLITQLGPLPPVADLSSKEIVGAIAHDKKIVEGTLHFIAAPEIGRTVTLKDVTEKDLKGALKNPNAPDDGDVDEPTLMPDDANASKDKKDDKSAAKGKDDKKDDDFQLMRAIDLLQGISLYRGADAAAVPSPFDTATKTAPEKKTP